MHARPFKCSWIVVLAIIVAGVAPGGFARIAHAESVYKCRAVDGAVAFQDQPCARGAAQTQVELEPPPPVSTAPDYGRASRESRVARERGATAGVRAKDQRETVSYECRAANGELFYRHGACPKQITAQGPSQRGKASQSYGVSAQALPRADVCRKLASAGSIGRAGHAHDENISTYDRNLGRDPCRYL